MQRRRVLGITAAILAALSLPALAQQEQRLRRIGYFSVGSVQGNATYLPAFREGILVRADRVME